MTLGKGWLTCKGQETLRLSWVFWAMLDFVIANFAWMFILWSFGFLSFSVYLGLSRYRKIRLGWMTSDRSSGRFRGLQ
jgi:choline-glycine betaine transporter